jgi:hypothetical protein
MRDVDDGMLRKLLDRAARAERMAPIGTEDELSPDRIAVELNRMGRRHEHD